MNHYQIYKNFYNKSKALRSEFESNFEDPRRTQSQRFVWDYWFFEDQYHLIRTPAFHYFSKNLYTDFHSTLVQWGRENLGCHDISPPWLSYYVDGCYQNLHSDVPHGPWAFVYSLTPSMGKYAKKFKGGETLILKPETLNYWNTFQDQADREYKSFVDRVPSPFNQLTVFDPRFPHGVTEVKGSRDPLCARLVVHGWFVEPRPYVVGGLSTALVQKSLTPQLVQLGKALENIGSLHGTLSLRLKINSSGKTESMKCISNSVLSLENNTADEKKFHKEIQKLFGTLKFPRASKSSMITVPLLFK